MREKPELSFAKQRFDSLAKPLAPCMWKLDAVISTCEKIQDMRGLVNKPRVALIVIFLGMTADATEECLSLTRF